MKEMFEKWMKVLPDEDKVTGKLLNSKIKFRSRETDKFSCASGFYTCAKQISKKVLSIIGGKE